jgi:Protein of unknown function (DUF5661)
MTKAQFILNKLAGVVAGGEEGLSSKAHLKPYQVDPKELKMGIAVEHEHSDNPKVQREIAMDHLTEHPKYYTGLAKMEKELTIQEKKNRIETPMEETHIKEAKHFVQQHHPKKVKEVYKALEREHPEYSAGKKARIANSMKKKAAIDWKHINKEYLMPSLLVGPIVGAGVTAASSNTKEDFKKNLTKGMGIGIAVDALTGLGMGLYNQRKNIWKK